MPGYLAGDDHDYAFSQQSWWDRVTIFKWLLVPASIPAVASFVLFIVADVERIRNLPTAVPYVGPTSANRRTSPRTPSPRDEIRTKWSGAKAGNTGVLRG